MDNVRLLDILISIVSGLLGWGGKVLWEAVAELRKDIHALESGLPKEYVRKEDWDRATDRISSEIRELKQDMASRMDAIWNKIDGKADKNDHHHSGSE